MFLDSTYLSNHGKASIDLATLIDSFKIYAFNKIDGL
jgi:hypothetical protein